MGVVESALEPIAGYFDRLYRNTEMGWHELQIGIYKNWVYDENDDIGCEVIGENEDGKLLKIFPKNHNIVSDDLISFAKIIINTNHEIAEKEKQFAEQMEEFKKNLEKQANDFYKEMDDLKEKSFKNINSKFIELKKENKNKKKEIVSDENNISNTIAQ